MIHTYNNISLLSRNSFGVDATADCLIEFEDTEDLRSIFTDTPPKRWMVMGGGNNILFTQDYHGTILSPTGQGITILKEQGSTVVVRVEAAMEWDNFVAWCVEQGLWGVENLSKIPSWVGAAPVQNIGAYGSDVSHTIQSVDYFCTEELTLKNLTAQECEFGYRESIFKGSLRGKAIITAVYFSLSREPQPRLGYGDLAHEVEQRGGATLRNIREAIYSIRDSKLPDPKIRGNAGSFFKNPIVPRTKANMLAEKFPTMPQYPVADDSSQVKLAAGWLIDQAGMKGYNAGSVGVDPRQALVLVNLGGATGEQVMQLAHEVQQKVKELFDIEIQTEVNIL